jgi:hypothetical protein
MTFHSGSGSSPDKSGNHTISPSISHLRIGEYLSFHGENDFSTVSPFPKPHIRVVVLLSAYIFFA